MGNGGEEDLASRGFCGAINEWVGGMEDGWGGRRVLGIHKVTVRTSQGGGALRYDGTILKVTDPRASLCNGEERGKKAVR